MKKLILMLAALGVLSAGAVAEDLNDPPWGDLTSWPETFNHWDFPTLLPGVPEEPPPPPPEVPSEVQNPFGNPFIVWPSGEMELPDAGGNPTVVNVATEVQWVDYVHPDGTVEPGVATVHIGVTDPGGQENNNIQVPVSIFIPNSPHENLVKKVFWQMTSDKSPTPQGDPPRGDADDQPPRGRTVGAPSRLVGRE